MKIQFTEIPVFTASVPLERFSSSRGLNLRESAGSQGGCVFFCSVEERNNALVSIFPHLSGSVQKM